ncbi:MAG TPA: putative transporter [Candidatus Alistipes avicola]|uniref:Transporter n=1 Tax=Candidatus Alistipes avicola TaxID=2838432 RepID=A0A9D2IAU0_9BACT|nr:putative transporter [uncultured Alistipes sp.]HJA98024.1 putative transporter [Candidatus Alistipes avicola]
MNWFTDLFTQHSAIQAVVVLSLISVLGMALGKIRFFGISLGVTFVFFIGIAAGHFGLSVDPSMLAFAESFGLILFVYALGLQVGPGFFSSLRSGGIRLVSLATLIVILGSLLAIALSYAAHVPMSDMAGILCGATTNTPALGAAQQMLSQMQIDSNNATLGCALTYPLGVVGVILGIIAVRKLFVRPANMPKPDTEHQKNVFIVEFKITNPGISYKSIRDVAGYSHHRFVISRLWRAGKVSIPTSDTTLELDDLILVITSPDDVKALELLFGEQVQKDWNTHDIDWDAVDSQLISRSIIVTRPEINGRKLSSLRLRNLYGINISRVHRSGVQLLATPDLTLQLGDSLTVVGEAQALQQVERILGNAVKRLDEPNLIPVFIGLILGLLLGSIPLAVPGISLPVKLGIAGGPIILGILIGTFGPRIHIVTYTTLSANLMLRALGLSLYLACLGLEAGAHFVETIMRPEGLLWIALGFLITFVPVVLVAYLSLRLFRTDFGEVAGIMCGSMANPMALGYANDSIPGDHPAVAYATVYPVCMFLRVIIIQILLMCFL